jgi:hypothetical protein
MRYSRSWSDTLNDFRQARWTTQLLLDLLLPPAFVAICWISGEVKARFYRNRFWKESSKEAKFLLIFGYALMIGCTIYVHVTR